MLESIPGQDLQRVVHRDGDAFHARRCCDPLGFEGPPQAAEPAARQDAGIELARPRVEEGCLRLDCLDTEWEKHSLRDWRIGLSRPGPARLEPVFWM